MKALWRRMAARFDALTLRERIFVSAAAMVALLALTHTFLLEPEFKRQQRYAAAMLQKQSEVRALEAQVQGLVAARGQGPDRAKRERLVQLNKELRQLEAMIGAEERRFTRPAQMRGVVEGVLARARGVELVEMKTLAVSTLAAQETKGKETKERPIYRHGLEITVAGSYLDLLAYVRDLEALPTQLYWGALHLDASKYPRVLMKLTVYTLSLDRAWLNV